MKQMTGKVKEGERTQDLHVFSIGLDFLWDLENRGWVTPELWAAVSLGAL